MNTDEPDPFCKLLRSEIAETSERSAELKKMLAQLKEMRGHLEDLNSKFEATRDFLRACGLSHVHELNEEWRRALAVYLKNALALLTPVDGLPS